MWVLEWTECCQSHLGQNLQKYQNKNPKPVLSLKNYIQYHTFSPYNLISVQIILIEAKVSVEWLMNPSAHTHVFTNLNISSHTTQLKVLTSLKHMPQNNIAKLEKSAQDILCRVKPQDGGIPKIRGVGQSNSQVQPCIMGRTPMGLNQGEAEGKPYHKPKIN